MIAEKQKPFFSFPLVFCLFSQSQSGCLRAGMQDVDRQTSRALLDFSYHLASGDMNEAYKVLNPILCYTTLMRSMPP